MLRRFAGFGGAPFLGTIATFLILPIVSRVAGADGWGGFATGQAVGLLGAVVVRFGWGITGPVKVARAPSFHERSLILEESIGARLVLSVLTMPMAAIITYLLVSPTGRWDAVAVAVATTLGGLSPGWFAIGEGRPQDLITYDVLPRLAATVVAAPVIIATGHLFWYPILLTLAGIAGAAVHRAHHVETPRRLGVTFRGSLRSIRRSASVAGLDATANAYGSTALPIASAGLTSVSLSAFASADRMYRFGLMLVEATGNAFQAWVLESEPHRVRRLNVSVVSHAALGLVGLLGLSTLGPWASAVVFGAEVGAERPTCIMLGVAYFSISTATPFIRNILVPHQRVNYIFASTVVSAVLGLVLMVSAALQGSAVGVAAGMAISEVLIMVLVIVPAIGLYRVEPPHERTLDPADR